MITRKVDKNEHLAGFIYNWVKKIGQQLDELRVISWQEGDSSGLPSNIKVYPLKTKENKLIKIAKFKMLVWRNIKSVDGVFCHQMPIYTILAAPFAKLYRKKIVSWYLHRQVDFKMRLMEKLADVILSASEESFRLPSKKLVITGHGINTDSFKPLASTSQDKIFRLISVGRISPTKDYESMIKAVDMLVDEGLEDLKLTIIGEAGLAEQKTYFENLKQMVAKMNLQNNIEFLGSKPNSEIPNYLAQSNAAINLSGTGSIDKAVLEAMACGCLVLTSNEAFKNILSSELMVGMNDPKGLAEKIKWLIDLPKDKADELKRKLRQEVVQNHNLDNLVKKIIAQFK